MADKEVVGILEALLPLAAAVFLCPPRDPRAFPAQAMQERIASLAPSLPCVVCEDIEAGYSLAHRTRPLHEPFLITGSLYLLGEAMRFLRIPTTGEPVS